MDRIPVRDSDSPCLLLGSVNSSLPSPVYLIPCYGCHQLVAMATGSRYPLLEDGKDVMPRGKVHSIATVLQFPGAQSSTLGG